MKLGVILHQYQNNTFQYNYTFINYSIEEINITELKEQYYYEILDKIKNNDDLKILKNNKITIVFQFKDKNGYEIFKFSYAYRDYK